MKKFLILTSAFVCLSLSAFAQGVCPPACPVVSGKGTPTKKPPVSAPKFSEYKGDMADFRALAPDVVVTPTNSVKLASEGSPMPTCQPCHPGCSENERDMDRRKLNAAFKAAFGLS